MINIDKLIEESIDEELYYARNSVNTNPTEKQKEAGNYKKGRIKINGFFITIENPKGSIRSGKNKDGHVWHNQMTHDYGYFNKTKGHDGDHIDVFIGDELESEKIYVVDQKIKGKFDESKVMFCFNSIEDAKEGYMSCYEKDWKGFWKITPVSLNVFKKWLYDGCKQRKPFFQYVDIIKHNKKEKLNEDIKKNEEGEIVPDTCPICGSKVGLYIKGEPVYLCSNKKCNKYFGVKPMKRTINETELISLINKTINENIDEINWGGVKSAANYVYNNVKNNAKQKFTNYKNDLKNDFNNIGNAINDKTAAIRNAYNNGVEQQNKQQQLNDLNNLQVMLNKLVQDGVIRRDKVGMVNTAIRNAIQQRQIAESFPNII